MQNRKYIINMLKKGNYVWGFGDCEHFTKREKKFYRMKAFICAFLLRLKKNDNYKYYDKSIPLVTYSSWLGWEGDHNWMELAVGKSLFRNWFITVYRNGT